MKTILMVIVGVCSATALYAAGASVSTDVPVPSRYSQPRVLADGTVVPPVPTRFQTRSVGSSIQPNAIVATPGSSSSRVVTNFGFSIILAADHGDIETVKKLLAMGASANIANSSGATALMAASSHGYIEIATLLLDKRADINQASKVGKTALIYAVQGGYVEMIQLLLKRGADPKVMDESGKTALDYALAGRRDDLVAALNGEVTAQKK